MAKAPSPNADRLRALREENYLKAQAANKAWAAAEAKAKPVRRKPKTVEVRSAGSGN